MILIGYWSRWRLLSAVTYPRRRARWARCSWWSSNPANGVFFLSRDLTTGLPLRMSNEIWSEWVKVIRRAEVRYRRPFQLRHTYASTLITEGANLKWLARQLGHGGESK